MIHSYKCKNFYSINDEVEVHFDVNNLVAESPVYVKDGETRLSLVENIIGPNASGKTNVIKVLSFLKYLIAETSSKDIDSEIPLRTFRDNSLPTEISTKFSVGEKTYVYEFILNKDRILKEVLKEQSRTEKRLTYKTLLSREWNGKSYSLTDRGFNVPSGLRLRKNASMVSRVWLVEDEGMGRASEIVLYWRDSVISNVREWGNLDDLAGHPDQLAHHAIKYLHTSSSLKRRATELMRMLDVGFSDFIKIEHEDDRRTAYSILHRFSDGKDFETPLRYESSGTKRVILMVRLALEALTVKGGIAALDELDAYLHPDLVEAIVKLFTTPETNKNNSQLLFTSHSHRLLAELDKQQITLVEKNDKGYTDVWRLDAMAGVRADDNYYTKYTSGAYGAKPKVEI